MPAMAVPFLGAAYSRACELTADRIGALVTNDDSVAMRALVTLAIGSEFLASETDIDQFVQQDLDVPPIAGFIHELYSTHPRMTRRVIELRGFAAAPEGAAPQTPTAARSDAQAEDVGGSPLDEAFASTPVRQQVECLACGTSNPVRFLRAGETGKCQQCAAEYIVPDEDPA